jgi:ribose-phosphate pyrophosphokinase
VPVETLSAVPSIVEALRPTVARDAVVVAPDLGAAKLATMYGEQLGLPVAMVRKRRVSGTEVSAEELYGDVEGRSLLVVDDMISTGGTVQRAVEAAIERGARGEVYLAATHGLFVGSAAERLKSLPLQRIVVTDSIGAPPDVELPLQVVGLAPLIAMSVREMARTPVSASSG